MSGIVKEFKEVLHKGMIENFERDGYLTPIMFFIDGDKPVITMIPSEIINSVVGKQSLANAMRTICKKPTVIAAGIIIEAYGAKIDDANLSSLVINGDLTIKELNTKKDIILLHFSSPEGDELIAYVVDVENKKVCERFASEDSKQFGGMFTNFFSWNRN